MARKTLALDVAAAMVETKTELIVYSSLVTTESSHAWIVLRHSLIPITDGAREADDK
jgi:hypothetical protein